MKDKNYTPRMLWLTVAVVVGTIGLGFIPPFELQGMSFARVDMLSSLRAETGGDDLPVEYEADIERLEMELAAMEMEPTVEVVDTLPEPVPVRYEWIVQEEPMVKRRVPLSTEVAPADDMRVVPIEDFDTLTVTRYERFIEKLANMEDVRIAFMGDSFVEGDILTSDLRHELQSLLGGRGVGFVACDIPFATVRKSVKRTSSGWTAYSVMKPKGTPEALRDKYFISGYIAEGGSGATTRWASTDTFATLDSCSRGRVLLYSRDTSRVLVEINDTLSREFEIAGDDHVREIYVEAPIDALRVKVLEGSVVCYGASLEGGRGITVDNFSVRCNNGHAIFGTGATVNRQIDEMLGYDLVVLQYGLNIMQPGQRVFARYRDQLRDMIAYAERCFPDAAIVVLGVSDRWVKNEESGAYEPIGSVDALTSYQRAAADSTHVAFWNTSEAMAIYGGMPRFVANGWAAKDYTHINFAGGRRVAEALARALRSSLAEELSEREAEAQRVAEEAERRALEHQMLIDRNLSATTILLDTLAEDDASMVKGDE
ncbi:MAG: hypothetical protein IJX40_02080 [Alistipes sp.]|nr:hypothetical protein [Alistipes sp.]